MVSGWVAGQLGFSSSVLSWALLYEFAIFLLTQPCSSCDASGLNRQAHTEPFQWGLRLACGFLYLILLAKAGHLTQVEG